MSAVPAHVHSGAVQVVAQKLVDQLRPIQCRDKNRHSNTAPTRGPSWAYVCPLCGAEWHHYMHTKKSHQEQEKYGIIEALEKRLDTVLQTMKHKKGCAYPELLAVTGGPPPGEAP